MMSTRIRMRTLAVLVGLLAAVPRLALAESVDCEGRCDDGMGNAMVVQNRCDDVAERCRAGCDRSGDRPQPYAECEATGRGAVPPPASPENPGGTRVRDGD